jgi:DNA-binding transcriptional ArsR family regulator
MSDAGPAFEVSRYDSAAALLRALGTPIRLAIVDLLSSGPRCVHELVSALGVAQPLVSQHLTTLRHNGLVVAERRGREVAYRLSDEHVSRIARDALAHARELPARH